MDNKLKITHNLIPFVISNRAGFLHAHGQKVYPVLGHIDKWYVAPKVVAY